MYEFGIIGNCNVSALISSKGGIDWLCLPYPDSGPVFGKLLDKHGGSFEIGVPNNSNPRHTQSYIENTNVLVTTVKTADGSSFKITDFCPRYHQYGRMFRPSHIFRIVEPLEGTPVINVTCDPVEGWSKKKLVALKGNSHIQFDVGGTPLRLTTNMPLTYLLDGSPFQVKEKIYFALTWQTPLEDDLVSVSETFLRNTLEYWNSWVKHCSIPTLFQKETIRSALALKLHCFEDTGAILAAITTSLPEQMGTTRNWDYRYSWLRDSYFALSAFHNLGHFHEMEDFLKFLMNTAHNFEHSRDRLHPVYAINNSLPLPEQILSNWEGYKGQSPVRVNNQAAEHIQNDVYGEMILAFSPIFFDERFFHLRKPDLEELLISLAEQCIAKTGHPDAGLWEIRNKMSEHSFTNLMCWAGLERISRIKKMGFLKTAKTDYHQASLAALERLRGATVNDIIHNTHAGNSIDAALSQASILRFPEKKIGLHTILEIQKQLVCGGDDTGFYYRYRREDDFGTPSSAFVACSFWIAQALAAHDKKGEALKIIQKCLEASNHLGLFSEHYSPTEKHQLGNFPQAYSHVGLINAAFAASPHWNDIL